MCNYWHYNVKVKRSRVRGHEAMEYLDSELENGCEIQVGHEMK